MSYRTLLTILISFGWAPFSECDTQSSPSSLGSIEVLAEDASVIDSSNLIAIEPQDYLLSDLSSVITQQSGLQSSSLGAYGRYSTFWMRGSSSKFIPVYYDGIQLNDPLSGGVNLSTIPLRSVQSIRTYKEVIPGFLGTNLGSGAISLTSRMPEEQIDIAYSKGSFGYQSIASNISDNNSILSGEWYASDNDYPYTYNNQTIHNTKDDYETHRKNADIDRRFLLLKSGGQLNNVNASGFVLYRNYNSGIANILNQAENAFLEQRSTLAGATIAYNQWTMTFSGDDVHQQYDDKLGEIGLGEDQQKIKYQKYNLSISKHLNHNNANNITTLRTIKEDINTTNISSNSSSNSHLSKTTHQLSNDFYYSTWLGLHVSWIGTETLNSNYSVTTSSIELTPLDYEYISTKLYAANKFRIPTISELYVNRGNIQNNPDLTKETFQEYGITLSSDLNTIGGNISFFNRTSKDTIILSYDSRGIGHYSNDGKSTTLGFESEVYLYLSGFEISNYFTWIETENLSSIKSNQGKYIPSFFHQTGTTNFAYLNQNSKYEISHQYNLNLYYDSANLVKAPDQSYWNLAAYYTKNTWNAGLQVTNLSDKRYTGFITEPLPGRSFTFSFSINL